MSQPDEARAPVGRDPKGRLALLMFLEYAAGGSFYMYLVLFLKQRGLAEAEVSRIMLSGAFTSLVGPPFWGMIADRFVRVHRLLPMLHGLSAVVLCALLAADGFASSLSCFVLLTAVRQPAISLHNAYAYQKIEDPGQSFGRLRLWGSIGWLAPALPILIWHQLSAEADMTVPVVLAIALHFTLAIGAAGFPAVPARSASEQESSYLRDTRALLSSRSFLALLGVQFLALTSLSTMFFYTSLGLEEVAVPAQWIGPITAAGVAFEVPLFILLRRVLDVLGYRRTLALGLACVVLRQFCFAWSDSIWFVSVSSGLIAPCVVYLLITASLAANAVAPLGVKATAQSLLALVGGGGGTVAGLFCADFLLQGEAGLDRVFEVTGCISAVGFLLIPWVDRGAAGKP